MLEIIINRVDDLTQLGLISKTRYYNNTPQQLHTGIDQIELTISEIDQSTYNIELLLLASSDDHRLVSMLTIDLTNPESITKLDELAKQLYVLHSIVNSDINKHSPT